MQCVGLAIFCVILLWLTPSGAVGVLLMQLLLQVQLVFF